MGVLHPRRLPHGECGVWGRAPGSTRLSRSCPTVVHDRATLSAFSISPQPSPYVNIGTSNRLTALTCAGCGKVTQIAVPWAREGSRFTLLFEALTLMLAPTMSVLAAGRLLRVRSRRLWRVINHHVGQARAQESHAEVRVIGVDETASKRGQTYLSVFHDLDKPRLLFATPGRDKATLGMFATDLTEHGGVTSSPG